MRRANLLRAILPAATGLMLVVAACSGTPANAQDIQGMLKAVDGKELVIQLDDGSTMRVQIKEAQATPEVRGLVGQEVKATVRSSRGGVRDLVKVERSLVNDDNRGRGRGEGRGRGGDDLLREDEVRDAAEDLHHNGIIEAMTADSFVIGGKTFAVNSATELDNGLAVGATARVEALVQPDGSLLATEIETDADDDLANDRRGRGLDDDARADEDRSGPNRGPGVGDDTSLLDDDRRGPNRGPGEGEVREVEDELRGQEPEARAQEPELRGREAEARGVEDFHFSGLIEAMSADSFTIGGKTFKVDGATMLDNGLAVGVLARVEFIALADGGLLATEIETDAPDEVMPQVQPQAGGQVAPAEVEDFHHSGLIESMSADSFTIGGKTFKVDAATMLDNGLAVGVLARVEFIALPDGSLLATEIETDAPDEVMPQVQPQAGQPAPASPATAVATDFHFVGVIESVGAGTWMIGGRSFQVDVSTILDTGLFVGVAVDVEFTVLPDGSFKAIKIETLVSGKNK
ncbi:MAG: hypothetical protein HYY01_14485 [Chloroflexi bacterium]|nr:hypothetical protein [Chloroflexota bacterium]